MPINMSMLRYQWYDDVPSASVLMVQRAERPNTTPHRRNPPAVQQESLRRRISTSSPAAFRFRWSCLIWNGMWPLTDPARILIRTRRSCRIMIDIHQADLMEGRYPVLEKVYELIHWAGLFCRSWQSVYMLTLATPRSQSACSEFQQTICQFCQLANRLLISLSKGIRHSWSRRRRQSGISFSVTVNLLQSELSSQFCVMKVTKYQWSVIIESENENFQVRLSALLCSSSKRVTIPL